MKEILLVAEDICKEFGREHNMVPVLNHVSVTIYRDDFTIIMGPSGAGKSTLLYALSGMDRISSGKVIYKGKRISHFKERQIADLRSREFGFVFQQTHLVSNLTLFENVAVAGYLRKDRTVEDTRKRSETLLEQMNVGNADWRLPIYHYDDYEDWEVMQYYDIPSRYEIPGNPETITSEKAGEVYYSEPNRIILFYFIRMERLRENIQK